MAAVTGYIRTKGIQVIGDTLQALIDYDESSDQLLGNAHKLEIWSDNIVTGTKMLSASLSSNTLIVHSEALTRQLGTATYPWNLYAGTITTSIGDTQIPYSVSGVLTGSASLIWTNSTNKLTLGTNARYSQGAHGIALDPDDWAVGSSSTNYVFYDDSTRTLTIASSAVVGSKIQIFPSGGYWRISGQDTNAGVFFPSSLFIGNNNELVNASAGGSIRAQSTSAWAFFNNAGSVYATFLGRTSSSDICLSIAQRVNTTGTPQVNKYKSGAHTTLSNAVLVHSLFDYGSTSQFVGAAGATTIATSDGMQIIAPVYGKSGAGSFTITDASTLTITADPSGVTFTRAMALWIKSGWSRFDGGLSVGAVTATTPGTGIAIIKSGLVVGADAPQTSGFEADVVGDLRVSQGFAVGGTVVPSTGYGYFIKGLSIYKAANASREESIEIYNAAGNINIGLRCSDSGAGLSDTEVIFNEQAENQDLRIEGQSLPYMFFIDASSATENIALLATAAINWQSMDRGLYIGNTSTAPTGNPSGGGFLYSESGALKWRGSSGTVTTLGTAHPYCKRCKKDFGWEWDSPFKFQMKFQLCATCLIEHIAEMEKAIEDLGKKLSIKTEQYSILRMAA